MIVAAAMAIVCSNAVEDHEPLAIVQRVVDKIIRETVFRTQPVLQRTVVGVQIVDFRRQFGSNTRGIGYALSHLIAEEDRAAILGLSSSGGVSVWLNDALIFQQTGKRTAEIKETSYDRIVFQDTLHVRLRKGANRVLVRSTSQGEAWDFFLRAVTEEGTEDRDVKFSLDPILRVAPADWLVVGPFSGRSDTAYPPEAGFEETYVHGGTHFVWRFPIQNLLSELVIPPTNSFRRDSYADWHYANGGTMLGILAVADRTGENGYLDFVRRYCDFIVGRLDDFRYQYEELHALRGSFHRIFRRTMLDDTGAPALPFVEMLLREEDPAYAPLVYPVADYVIHQQVRLEDGTLCRPEPVEGSLWADDVFMSVPFLLRMARLTGEPGYDDECAAQIPKFYAYLTDPETGLLFHGWFGTTEQTSIARWGRANGWVVWAVSEALTHLPQDHPGYEEILELFAHHISSLAAFQDKSGMWHQVLDRSESFEETSCTAMFVLGMARGVRHGWIEASFRDNALRGWRALTRKIDADGTVHDICRGTGIGEDLDFYFTRQRFDHDPRGLGAMMTAGVEIDRLMRTE